MWTLTPLRKCPRAFVCHTLTAHLSLRPQIHITLPLQTITATTVTVHSAAERPTAGSSIHYQPFPYGLFWRPANNFCLCYVLLYNAWGIHCIHKDAIKMLHITKMCMKEGKDVNACLLTNTPLLEWICSYVSLQHTLWFSLNFFPLWRSEGKQVQFELSGLKYRERK